MTHSFPTRRSSERAGHSSVSVPEFPRAMERTTYYLEFPSREAIDTTLHDAKIPTLDTYRNAISIVREISTWTLIAAGKGEKCSVSVSMITLADIPEIGRASFRERVCKSV